VKLVWPGRILTALPTLMLIMSGVMKLLRNPQVLEAWTPKFGYPESTLLPIGVVELACTALYLFPRTAVLGAILLTGYLGGATATHVRVADAFIPPVLLGVLVWGGLWCRDSRVRALLPLRGSEPA
jgi:hypothetical protein